MRPVNSRKINQSSENTQLTNMNTFCYNDENPFLLMLTPTVLKKV